MTTIPPAAAREAVRPIASTATRMMGTAAIGVGATTGLALWADHHFREMPDADGTSEGRIDRVEARNLFSGFDGAPAVVTFTALLAASFLYSRGRDHITPKEFSMLRTSYWLLGGGLVGTAMAPALLRPLPAASGSGSGAAAAG